MLFAFETLKRLQQEGNVLILWTYRSGARLDEAVQFCKDNGLTFYAINKSYPEEALSEDISRKINADVFIDDRDVRGMMGWGEIYQLLGSSAETSPTLKQKRSKPARKKTKKSFMSRIEELFKDENA